jgi:DNA topoisomerase-1
MVPEGKKLVIVESPAKAKTIGKYLGDDYEVMASVGHVRDLAQPKELPAELKKTSLGRFAVDVDNGFEPYYVTTERGRKTVSDLKKAAKGATEIYLATDEDREGEAIAWHLLELLKPKVPVKRMVFHEITEDSIRSATSDTRDVDTALVDAQETRRIVDRLYGFEVSPVLWRRVSGAKSAGRVQSPALRLIVDRELERRAFIPAVYSDVKATVETGAGESFVASVARLDGTRVASGRDFSSEGELKDGVRLIDPEVATALVKALEAPGSTLEVAAIDPKPYTRRPAAPFTTSTLQQEAGRKLRFSAQQTMSVAQGLYENGYITYMRTDSVSLSQQAISAARAQAKQMFGPSSVPESPRLYKGKSQNAQEAHEAVRPAGEAFKSPDDLSGVLRPDELKLYELIWRRTVASQMVDAKGQTVTVTLGAADVEVGGSPVTVELTASGTVLFERGFLQAYEESNDDDKDDDGKSAVLPKMEQGERLGVTEVSAKAHETQPPARFTEASLVKALEERGIGRPSTYASIISTIIDRGYVSRRGSAMIPQWIAFPVTRLLSERFSELVDYQFTAELEEDLDRIARGEYSRQQWLQRFYFGDDDHRGLKDVALLATEEIDTRELNTIAITDTISLRVGKYSPFLETLDEETGEVRRVNLPPELAPDELTPQKAQELIDAPPVEDRVLGIDPESLREVVAKKGRFGPYVTEVIPEDEAEAAQGKKKTAVKPKTASLFQAMDIESIDLDTALKLLSLPREVGPDPESGEMITAQNGRYGPYLKKGTDTRSLDSEDLIFEIDVPGAVARFAEPKYGGRRQTPPLKTLEVDSNTGKAITVKNGRFGPYVTDGETNVTVPRGIDPAAIDQETAERMLAEKRAKGPAPKRAAKKPAAKKTTAKKSPVKKPAAKKTPVKKPAAKKTTSPTTTVKNAGAKKAAAKTGTKTGNPSSKDEG